jgi:hypothetical protein
MNKGLVVLLWTGLLVGNASGATLEFQVNQTGNTGTYMYFWNGGPFAANTELDIRFDASVFQSISNPSSHPGFDVRLFQPNSPPGTTGILSLLSQVDNSLLATAVSLQFVLSGGQTAGPQQFFVNQYDAQTGELIAVLDSGTTAPVTGGAVPEPGTLGLACIGLLLGGAAIRRRSALAPRSQS